MQGGAYDVYFDLALSLATEAGKVIREAFHSEKQGVVFKDAVDLVTATDKQVEEFVMSKIQERFPDHLFVAEEVRLQFVLLPPEHFYG
jgi:myo-inositol-1(or 4)-monophosphatase